VLVVFCSSAILHFLGFSVFEASAAAKQLSVMEMGNGFCRFIPLTPMFLWSEASAVSKALF